MILIDLLQIQADLAHYIEQVARGETIVVTRDNEPIAELRPVAPSIKKTRAIGLAKGTFEIPASFYEPLPPEVIKSFILLTPGPLIRKYPGIQVEW
jgi:prevent-host-death family protein